MNAQQNKKNDCTIQIITPPIIEIEPNNYQIIIWIWICCVWQYQSENQRWKMNKMAITHHYCWIVNMKTMMSHIPHACIHFIQLIYFNDNDIKLITSSSSLSLSTESIYLWWWWWCSIFKNGGVEWSWTQSLIPLFLTSSKLTRHNHHHPRPHVNCFVTINM